MLSVIENRFIRKQLYDVKLEILLDIGLRISLKWEIRKPTFALEVFFTNEHAKSLHFFTQRAQSIV